jgi:hypothetical protein
MPHREVKSKNFIEKVMFLAMVTRPRFDENGNCIFDGKFSILVKSTLLNLLGLCRYFDHKGNDIS